MKRRTAFRLAMVAGFAGPIGAIALSGCASILGFEDTELRDDGGAFDTGTDTGVDGGRGLPAACRPVTTDGGFLVLQTMGWIAPDGTYVKCTSGEPKVRQVTVSVRNDAGLSDASLATGEERVDGVHVGFVFGALGPGERYVRVERSEAPSTMYVVRGDRLDFGVDDIGRHDTEKSMGTMVLTVDDGGAPEDPDAGRDPDRFTSYFIGGNESFQMGRFSYSIRASFLEIQLLDRTRGDAVWLTRDKLVAEGFRAVFEVYRFPDDFAMIRGGQVERAIRYEASPTRRVSVRMGDFSKIAPAGGHVVHDRVALGQVPPGNRLPTDTVSGYGVSNMVAQGRLPQDGGVDFDFVDPTPHQWPLIARAQISFIGSDAGPDTDFMAMRALTDAAISPLVAPVRVVRVGGKNVLGASAIEGVGPAPLIVLTPPVPSTGHPAPRSYRIALHDGSNQSSAPLLEIITSGTEVALPRGILQSGKTYYLYVAARYAEGYSDEEPLRGNFPSGEAVVITNLFRIDYD